MAGSAVVGSTVAGSAVVGSAVAGSAVVGSTVAGSAVVGSAVVGSAVAGSTVAGSAVTVAYRRCFFQAMVPLLVRLHALVPMVQRQPHRVCYFLDCPRKFRLRPLWWLKKSPDFSRAGHRIVKPTLLLSFFPAPEAYKRVCSSNSTVYSISSF